MYGFGQRLVFGVCSNVTVYVIVFSNMYRCLGCRILAKATYDMGPCQGYYDGYSVKYLITSVTLCLCQRYVHFKQ